jgi:hypothetical protein
MGCGRVLTKAAEAAMFSGFESSIIDVGNTTILIRRRGSGRPLLLLHGFLKRISCGTESHRL